MESQILIWLIEFLITVFRVSHFLISIILVPHPLSFQPASKYWIPHHQKKIRKYTLA